MAFPVSTRSLQKLQIKLAVWTKKHANNIARIMIVVIFLGLAIWSITLERYTLVIGYSETFLWLTTALKSVGPELAGIVIGVVSIDYFNQRRQDQQLKKQLIIQLSSRHNDVTDTAIRTLRAYGWLLDGSLEGVRIWNINLQKDVLFREYLAKDNLSVRISDDENRPLYLYDDVLLVEGPSFEEDLRGANLKEAALWGANLRRVDLWKANLQNANLMGADLSETNLVDANLQYANLQYANLQNANLTWANLKGADLSFANLKNANLERGCLNGADFENANLDEAILDSADFRKANLRKATLEGTFLWFAFLEGATMPDGRSFEEWTQSRENQVDKRALEEVNNVIASKDNSEEE